MYAVRPSALVDVLGHWGDRDAPLNQLLASAIAEAIARGDLPDGCRLPSERNLAATVGVSRTTVTLAYDRLRSRGLVVGRAGAGTSVSMSVTRGLSDEGASATLPSSRFGDDQVPGRIELTVGALEGSQLVADVTSEVVRDDLAGLLKLRGYLPLGLPELRQRLADHLTRLDVRTAPEQILVTTGAQQALDLLAREVAGPDVSVMMENPTYLGAIDAFRAAGMRLVPVAVDHEGLRVDLARNASFAVGPRLLYVMPNHHNPTGATLGDERRRELARLAHESGFLIAEDLSPDLSFGAGLPPPIAAYDPAERVVSIGSFNKLFWGGLRVGWVRGPTRLIERLGARKVASDHATSILTQAIAARLLARFEEQVPLVRDLVRDRRVAATSALARQLPEWVWQEPSGGMSLWIRLPFGNAADFARIAEGYGVVVRPGPLFSPAGGYEDYLRLAYGETPDRVTEGIARLARAWADYGRSMTETRRMSSTAVSV